MPDNGGTGEGPDGGERRLEQTLVVAVCVLSLVVAGALAPTVGSPFQDGPALNVSTLADGVTGNDEDVPRGARELSGPIEASSTPQAIGSPDASAVGGASALTGFRNQSRAVQFVVESERNAYYRVGAYQSFDGYEWSRDGETTPFSGAVPGATPPGERFEARVTLNATAFAVPVPWRPTSVEGPTPLSVRSTDGVVPRASLAPNQTFAVTAVAPTRDPAVLAETGYGYPSSVKRQYLEVDTSVSPRVDELAARITADADDPYAEAKAIESWLEANKEYSLNATTDPERPVTRQFLFEMERGYCQYFASAMAVMLRTQGIPARYVVGYAPGTQVGEDTYAVTGAKAHAWVEVYFEDVGWVRFDPTPAAGRLAADRAIANDSTVAEAAANVSDSTDDPPTRVPTTGDGTTDGGEGTGTTTGGDGTGGGEAGSLNVSVRPEPTPGAQVTVRVTRSGEPVVGADVYFDEDYVGTTDYDGEVVAVVPYETNLTIRVEADDESFRAGVPPPPGDVGPNGASVGAPRPPDNESNGTTTELSVATAMTFSLASRPLPGSTTAMRVTINGEPVRYARVTVDGEPAGRTNATGWVRVALPSDATSVRVAAERGEVRDSTRLSLYTTADVTVEGDAVPGSTLRVAATYDGELLSEAPVFVNGERVTTTGETGRAIVRVPEGASGTLDVRVERGVVSGTASPQVVTTGTVTVEGRASPNGTAVVVVTAAERPLADATVSVAGEPVGTTDTSGRATVAVPPTATGNVTVRATRGSVAASREVDLFEPNVSVRPAYLVALPGANATANVTDGGEPIAGATVAVGGVEGRTGEHGVVEAALPFRNAVTVRATVDGVTTTTRLDWLFANLLATVAALGAALALGVGTVVQRGRVGVLAARARRFVARVGRAATDALFALAARVDEALEDLPGLPARLLDACRRVAARPVASARVLAATATGAVVAVAGTVAAWLRPGGRASEPEAGTAADGDRSGADGDPTTALVGAWRRLVALAAPSRVRTRTPGEIARTAVDRGLPSEPVEALTETYRRAAYGGEAPDDADAATAQSAARELERAAGESTVDGDGGGGDEGETDDGGRR